LAIVAPLVPTTTVSTSPSASPASSSWARKIDVSSSDARPTRLPARSANDWISLSSGTTVPAVLLCCGLKTTTISPPFERAITISSTSESAMSASPFSRNAVEGISSAAGASSASTFSSAKKPSSSATSGG
jgi:hypothetical protein